MKTIIGLIFFIAPLLSLEDQFENLQIEKHGQIVKMVIVDKPSKCIFTKVKHFAKFKFNGKIYSKPIGVSFCNKHFVGESIEMKYLKGYDKIMYPNEKTVIEFISIASLSAFGLFMIYLGNKKKAK